MKVKKLFFCLLLAILTIGTVCAQDNISDTGNLGKSPENISALAEDANYTVRVPEEFMDSTYYGSDIASVENMPSDARGNISITVDELERYNRKVISGPNAISLGELDLAYGNHNITIAYTGDGKYDGFLRNFTFERVYMMVECPDEFTITGGEYSLDVGLAKGVTGNVKILIDNKSIYNRKYDAGNPPGIDLTGYVGHHTYEVQYYNGNQKNMVKKGAFDALIFNEPYFSNDGIIYGDSVKFEMEIPSGSQAVARLKDKQYKFSGDDWYTYVTISGFDVGENIVEFTVNYGKASQTRTCTVNVLPKITLPDVMLINRTYNLTFDASERINGNLELSGMMNGTVKVSGGKATVPISGATAGNYTLNIRYENYTWSRDVHVLEEAPKVAIYINYSDEIHPWDGDYDYDPDHEDFLYYVSVLTYPSYNLTGNTEIYVDNELKANITGNVDKYHLWPDYFDFGPHNITVKYLGDDTFKPATETFTYTVSPYACSVDEYGTVWVTVAEDVSGTLSVKVNGKTYSKKIASKQWHESYAFPLDGLKKNINYTADINFKANKAGWSFSKSLNFKMSCRIYLVHDYIYGAENGMVFYLPKDIKNRPSVSIDGKKYNYKKYTGDDVWYDEENQIAYAVDISDLKPGIHDVAISYPGDEKYPSASINEAINITVEMELIDEFESEDGSKVRISLPSDAKGNMVMEIMYDGESDYTLFKTVALKDGRAEIKLPFGSYDYIVYYSGKDYQVKVWKSQESLYPDVSYSTGMTYGQRFKFNINDDVNGTLVFYLGWDVGARLPVAWFDLSQTKAISVNKKLIDDALTHSMAKLIMNQNYANDGEYTLILHPIICSDRGSFDYTPIYIDFNYKITGATNVNMYYTASKTVSLKVYDLYGKLVGKNQVVKIKIGKSTYQAKTDRNGVAKFKIPTIIAPGKYKMTLTYKNKKVTKTLTVKKIISVKSVKVKKSAKKLVLTATLKKVNKKYLKNKKITFKFNGKKYTAKTNNKGIAKVTIKKAVLKKLKVGKKITYQATYLKDTVKKSVKVKK